MTEYRGSRMSLVLTAVCLCAVRVSSEREEPYSVNGPLSRIIRVATYQVEPYVSLKWEPGLLGNERYEGYYVDLLSELAGHAGFGYQFYLVPDGRIGSKGDDGTWNGLIGELTQGTADLALVPISATPERLAVVQFSRAVSPVQLSVLIRVPRRADDSPARVYDLQDLRRKHDIQYGVVRSSEISKLMFHRDGQTNRGLLDRLPGRNHPLVSLPNVLDGLERLRSVADFGLILETELADYYASARPCELAAVKVGPTGTDYALAVRNNSAILAELNEAIDLVVRRENSLPRLKRKWWSDHCSPPATAITDAQTRGSSPSTATQRRHLRITTMMEAPYLMASKKRGAAVRYDGYIADLIRQMAHEVPFDYEWKVRRGFGKKQADGSWTGMIGDLVSGEADMAAAPFVVTRRQEKVLTFSKPFLHSTLAIVLQAPSGGEDVNILFLDDLLNQTRYDFGAIRQSRVTRQLRKSKMPVYKQIWKTIKSRGNLVTSLDEGLRRVRTQDFALIMESTEATFLSSKRPCDLLSMSQFLTVTHYAFTTRKGSPLIDSLNDALQQLQQRGRLQMLFHKWWNTDECLGFTQTPDDDSVARAEDYDIANITYVDDHGVRDSQRIFLTSPVETFTPAPLPTTSTLTTLGSKSTSTPVGRRSSSEPATTRRATTTHPTSTATTTTTTTPPPTTRTTTTTTSTTKHSRDAKINRPIETPQWRRPSTMLPRSSTDKNRIDSSTTVAPRVITRRTTEKPAEVLEPAHQHRQTTTTTPKYNMPPAYHIDDVTSASDDHQSGTSMDDAVAPQEEEEEEEDDDDDDEEEEAGIVNIDWFFATHQPRPENYDDYEGYDEDYVTPIIPDNFTFDIVRDVWNTNSWTTVRPGSSSARHSHSHTRAVTLLACSMIAVRL